MVVLHPIFCNSQAILDQCCDSHTALAQGLWDNLLQGSDSWYSTCMELVFCRITSLLDHHIKRLNGIDMIRSWKRTSGKFERVCKFDDSRVLPGWSHELDTKRHTILIKSYWYRDCWPVSNVGKDREIALIDWHFSFKREGGLWSCGCN